jgi:hypothetical protein
MHSKIPEKEPRPDRFINDETVPTNYELFTVLPFIWFIIGCSEREINNEVRTTVSDNNNNGMKSRRLEGKGAERR